MSRINTNLFVFILNDLFDLNNNYFVHVVNKQNSNFPILSVVYNDVNIAIL